MLAVNVCVVPDAATCAAVCRLAARTCNATSSGDTTSSSDLGPVFYQAGSTHGSVGPTLPHITLLQCFVRETALAAFVNEVRQVVREVLGDPSSSPPPPPCIATLESVGVPGPVFGELEREGEMMNVHMPAVAVSPSQATGAPTVEQLHERLVAMCLALRDAGVLRYERHDNPDPSAAADLAHAFVPTLAGEGANGASVKWTATFATELARDNFFPHITLGTALASAVLQQGGDGAGELAVASTLAYDGPASVRVQAVSAAGAEASPAVLPDPQLGRVVVAQMGNFCSCSRVLAVL